MKKRCACLLAVCLLLTLLAVPAVSMAETVYGTVLNNTQISTGPGERYGVLHDVRLFRGDRVLIRTKYSGSGSTWLQVEFSWRGELVRGYVRQADVSAELRRVPVEAPLCTGRAVSWHTPTGTGPHDQGFLLYPSELRQYSSAIVYEVDDGYAHIEYWNYGRVEKWRSWVPLSDLQTEWSFRYAGYYGSANVETSLHQPSPTKAPSTYYGSTGRGYPVGMMCTVVSGSCHVKRGAGENYQTVGYAYVGERYEVLECKTGSTGKDWYRIEIDGAYGWISSGLVSLD